MPPPPSFKGLWDGDKQPTSAPTDCDSRLVLPRPSKSGRKIIVGPMLMTRMLFQVDMSALESLRHVHDCAEASQRLNFEKSVKVSALQTVECAVILCSSFVAYVRASTPASDIQFPVASSNAKCCTVHNLTYRVAQKSKQLSRIIMKSHLNPPLRLDLLSISITNEHSTIINMY